jgi:protein-S-isoprenylcysteine O-methyltransferase Ste14
MTRNSGRHKILWTLLLFRLLVGGMVALYGPYNILSSHPEQPLQLSVPAVIGGLAVAVGLSVYLRCVWDFAFCGQGDAPNLLVARGTYKLVRNPMYLGLVLILLGESLLFTSWWLVGYAAVFWAGVHLMVILYEERALAKQLGASYAQYCKVVPRWIPRLHRPAE